jgi:hypothetical protein
MSIPRSQNKNYKLQEAQQLSINSKQPSDLIILPFTERDLQSQSRQQKKE